MAANVRVAWWHSHTFGRILNHVSAYHFVVNPESWQRKMRKRSGFGTTKWFPFLFLFFLCGHAHQRQRLIIWACHHTNKKRKEKRRGTYLCDHSAKRSECHSPGRTATHMCSQRNMGPSFSFPFFELRAHFLCDTMCVDKFLYFLDSRPNVSSLIPSFSVRIWPAQKILRNLSLFSFFDFSFSEARIEWL